MIYKKRAHKLLGEILLEAGIIDSYQLKSALSHQLQEGGLIGEMVAKLGFANEDEIAQCVSFQYGFPYLPLENYDIPEEVMSIVAKGVLDRLCLVPIDKIGDTLTIAMSDPLDAKAIKELEEITSLNIQIFISTSTDIRDIINRCYNKDDD